MSMRVRDVAGVVSDGVNLYSSICATNSNQRETGIDYSPHGMFSCVLRYVEAMTLEEPFGVSLIGAIGI